MLGVGVDHLSHRCFVMKQYLTREKIKLRPATIQDREKIFLWLTKSNLTKEMMGPPYYPDSKIPTWDEFINDYYEYYFNGSHPLKGQCFIIEHNGQEIGQINHNEIDTLSNTTDLDIWLSDKKHTGKGIGTDAINILPITGKIIEDLNSMKIYIDGFY